MWSFCLPAMLPVGPMQKRLVRFLTTLIVAIPILAGLHHQYVRIRFSEMTGVTAATDCRYQNCNQIDRPLPLARAH